MMIDLSTRAQPCRRSKHVAAPHLTSRHNVPEVTSGRARAVWKAFLRHLQTRNPDSSIRPRSQHPRSTPSAEKTKRTSRHYFPQICKPSSHQDMYISAVFLAKEAMFPPIPAPAPDPMDQCFLPGSFLLRKICAKR